MFNMNSKWDTFIRPIRARLAELLLNRFKGMKRSFSI